MSQTTGSLAKSLTVAVSAAAVALLGITVWLGLFVTDPDSVQGEYVRLIYIHPAVAWTSYVAFGVTAAASALYLWPKSRRRFWDLLAGASAEVGLMFCGLTLITGAIWGKASWGVWWTWDARLTTTALLYVLFLGYLALRRMPGDTHARARRSAIAALVAVIDIPVVHLSVEWWRTLHQGPTLVRTNPTIHGLQLTTMLLSFLTFTLVYVALLIQRYRLERLESSQEVDDLAAAVAERRSTISTSPRKTDSSILGATQ